MESRCSGLRRFWERGDARRLNPAHVRRISRVLSQLNAANYPSQLNRPANRLHQLRGNRRDFWSVRVSGNWRITFRFEGSEAVDVHLEDYH